MRDVLALVVVPVVVGTSTSGDTVRLFGFGKKCSVICVLFLLVGGQTFSDFVVSAVVVVAIGTSTGSGTVPLFWSGTKGFVNCSHAVASLRTCLRASPLGMLCLVAK